MRDLSAALGAEMSGGNSRTVVQLVAIPRGKGEELRLSVDEFEPDDGSGPKQYLSLRVFWRSNDGEMRPGKSGTTIRRGELRGVIAALQRAEKILTGQEKVESKYDNTGSGNAVAGAREHRTQHGRQGQIPGTRRPNEQDYAGPGPSEEELEEDARRF